jgi:N-acyl-D-aspartate/D-glutamate deacylase
MDPETDFDDMRNVGIKDGTIVTITKDSITGKETIDATGHVVAAGFIDTHVHSSKKYNIKMSMMDGVTTALDLEAGAVNIVDWYEREQGKWPMNYGQSVSHELVRMVVHDSMEFSKPTDATQLFESRAKSVENDDVEGWSVTVSNLEQINQITKILDENLRQGALGVGCTVGYAKTGISTYECFEIQRAAARYGRLTAFHTRFHTQTSPPVEATMGFGEIFTNACLLKAPLLVCHNNDYGWWEIEEKLSMARDMGMNMWAEYYPYAAGSTAIAAEALRPESLEGMLGLKYEEVIYDPTQDKFLNKEEYLKVVKGDPGRTIIAYNLARNNWMEYWLKMPHMTVGSDAMWSTDKSLDWNSDPAKFSGHPRTSGTHSTTLRMAREAGVPLMFTLSQLSYWSALHLGNAGLESMKVRGRMQEGMVADIVVFNPETVREGSSYKKGENGLPPIGLPHLIVNGVFVKKDNTATDAYPGQPIRYPVEEKGRFVPATKKQWQKTFTIDTSPLKPRAKKK